MEVQHKVDLILAGAQHRFGRMNGWMKEQDWVLQIRFFNLKQSKYISTKFNHTNQASIQNEKSVEVD